MAQRRIGARSCVSFRHTPDLNDPRLGTPSPSGIAPRCPNSTNRTDPATAADATIPIVRGAPPSELLPRFPCMGRLLSSAACSPLLLCFLAERRRTAPTLWRTTGLGTRTGQGRKPRSGRASARALTRSIPSPPASGGLNLINHHQPTIRAEPCHGRGSSRHNLVFGGSNNPNHDAVMRIGSEAPKQRTHSPLRHESQGNTSGPRHLEPSSAGRHRRTDWAEIAG